MSAPGPDSKKRRRPQPQYYPPGPRLFAEPGPPVWVPSDRGHVRLDKILLARLARIFPQCALVWMIFHIMAETTSAVEPRPEYADIDNESWRVRLGVADRTREKLEGILEATGVLSREHADYGHNRGGYKVNITVEHLDRIPIKPPKPPRLRKPAAASQRSGEPMAAYRRDQAEECTVQERPQHFGDVIKAASALEPGLREAALAAAQSAAEAAMAPFLEAGAHGRAFQEAPQSPSLRAEPLSQILLHEAHSYASRPEVQAVEMRVEEQNRGIRPPGLAGRTPALAVDAPDQCPLREECPLYRNRKQEVPSSSSVGNATGTTTGDPDRSTEVKEAARMYANVDPAGLRLLLAACTPHSTAAICAAIHAKGSLARTKKNPFGFLLTAVPNWLKDRANIRAVPTSPIMVQGRWACPMCHARPNFDGYQWRCPGCGMAGTLESSP